MVARLLQLFVAYHYIPLGNQFFIEYFGIDDLSNCSNFLELVGYSVLYCLYSNVSWHHLVEVGLRKK
jgi:hypothetical protein